MADRDAELRAWRRRDRDDLDAALARVPVGLAEAMVQRALELFDLANAATNGALRVSPLGPPSRITSTAEWMEDLRQDLAVETFFEHRLLELRPDLLPGHARFAVEPAWPAVRAGVARVVSWSPSAAVELLARARRADGGG